MAYRPGSSERILPIALCFSGLLMTALSIMLLISAAKLGVFMHMMLGFIGVNFVNSVILSFVTIQIAVGKKADVSVGEKLVLLGLSLCTGIGLVIA